MKHSGSGNDKKNENNDDRLEGVGEEEPETGQKSEPGFQPDRDESRRLFIFCLLAVLGLSFLNMVLPVFTLAVVVIWPLPVVYLALRQGMRRAGFMIVIAALINGLVFNPLLSLVTVAGFGFIGFVMASALLEKFQARRILLMTVAAAVISNLVLASVLILGTPQSLEASLTDLIREAAEPLIGEELSPMLEMQMRMIVQLLPSILMISGIVTGILNYYFVHWFLKIKDINVPTYKSVARWHFPAGIVSLVVVLGLLFRGNTIMFNLAALGLFSVFLQGFAAGLYFVRKKTGSRMYGWLYIMAVVLIPVFPLLLIVAGLLDIWLDFRKIKYTR